MGKCSEDKVNNCSVTVTAQQAFSFPPWAHEDMG